MIQDMYNLKILFFFGMSHNPYFLLIYSYDELNLRYLIYFEELYFELLLKALMYDYIYLKILLCLLLRLFLNQAN